MEATVFDALQVKAVGDGYERMIVRRQVGELPAGEVLIRVQYSSLNYKDALSASGNRGVTKSYPHTPGIDAAGVVAASSVAEWQPGDPVLVTGFDLGMNTAGGFGEYVRVPAAWVVRLPAGLTPRESMALGTAGFTAALSILKLQAAGLAPDHGEVLVTGATGGVGSLAVLLLARLGYDVVAATGKTEAYEFLRSLGAQRVIGREEAAGDPKRSLAAEHWAGVLDTVGGPSLVGALKAMRYGGMATTCGMVAGSELTTTVFPFILRGVGLLGVDSVLCPMPVRQHLWQLLSSEWKPANLNQLVSEVSLAGLSERIDAMLAGQLTGRTVVAV